MKSVRDRRQEPVFSRFSGPAVSNDETSSRNPSPGGFLCDPAAGGAVRPASGEGARSRVLRGVEPGRWEGVPDRRYKDADGLWDGVVRRVLVGEAGEATAFHLRYFEVAPGGYSTLERHRHAHAVIVLRGEGECVLGGRVVRVRPHDLIYVAPDEVHQLRNPGREPFGFLCVVDALRDRPEAVAAPERAG